MSQRRNRRAGVEDRWRKRDGTPSANDGKGKRWRARYVDSDGREVVRGFTRKVDAQTWLDGITSTIVTGDYVAPGAGTVTVAELHKQWDRTQGHVKATTKAARESAWSTHVKGRWGKVQLVEIQTSAVRAWVADMAESRSPATIEKALGVLRMVCDLAVEDRRLARNPCDGVKAPRRENTDRGYLTHVQVDRLARQMVRDQLVVRFLAYTGLRYGEMAALRVCDFDMLRRRVQVQRSVTEVSGKLVWSSPKSYEKRSVPFPKMLASDLAAAMEGKGRDDLVFAAPAGGVLRIATFRTRVFGPAVKKLIEVDSDFPKVTLHDLRHTAASLAISAGANVKAVQTMLGHKSAALTLDTYADLFPDDLEAVAAAMDKAAADALRTEADRASASSGNE